MKAPASWLGESVDLPADVDELASRLAMTGTEVERVTPFGVPGDADNLRHFVIGKVVGCARHPDADKLSVCTVDVGEAAPRTIVCGAPNVAAGQTVAVVLPGGVMPNGMVIKDAKLRGVQSAGMILSEAELGLATKSEGIVVLPVDWRAGDLLAGHAPIADSVLEIEVTPNRPDCLSIEGLAREIAAITGQPYEEVTGYEHPWGDRLVGDEIAIEVRDPDLCPRYAVRVIKGVTIDQSPLWLKARIVQAGMRPVSNVVDVTNYVMWAIGQPLHAFDLRTIRGGRIIVRRALLDEAITTLDAEHRVLADDMLVIADAERASVIAGIMGSVDSEVTDDTRDILLEAATFSGPSIMRTSSALGLRSEASTRFEKNLDPELVMPALDLACKMLVEICGGTVSVGTIDVRVPPAPPREIVLRVERLEHVLGASIPETEAEEILVRLGCAVRRVGSHLHVRVPTFRADLAREIDLIEEVARIHGLDLIPSTLPARRAGRGGLDAGQCWLRQIEDSLVGAGLSEVVAYSFGDARGGDRLRLSPDDPRRLAVTLANPLGADQATMRTMLLPGLLDIVRRNFAVRQDRVHVFEIGKTFHPAGPGLPDEVRRAGILLAGRCGEESWLHPEAPTDYYVGKGLVERLAALLKVELKYEPATESFLHPGKSAVIEDRAGKALGWLGEVHPLVLQSFDLRGTPVIAAELDIDALIALAPGPAIFSDLLAFPPVEQDLALVVDKGMPGSAVVAAAKAAGGKLLEHVVVFDVYEGAQVAAGKKSLAMRLSFRSPDRTLSEAEVNDIRARMLKKLRETIAAELRS